MIEYQFLRNSKIDNKKTYEFLFILFDFIKFYER